MIVPLEAMISSGLAEGLPVLEASLRCPRAVFTELTALSSFLTAYMVSEA